MAKVKAYVVIEHVIDGQHRVRCVNLSLRNARTCREKIQAKYGDFQKKTCTLNIKEFIIDDIIGIGRVIDG